MFLNDFDFDLVDELIATRPANPRTSARLLVAKANKVDDSTVNDLPKYLKPGDRLVFNDTKVIPARSNGVRNRLIDNETKVDYATHIFAKALDEMVDYLDSPRLLN